VGNNWNEWLCILRFKNKFGFHARGAFLVLHVRQIFFRETVAFKIVQNVLIWLFNSVGFISFIYLRLITQSMHLRHWSYPFDVCQMFYLLTNRKLFLCSHSLIFGSLEEVESCCVKPSRRRPRIIWRNLRKSLIFTTFDKGRWLVVTHQLEKYSQSCKLILSRLK
jgi:hypothetical protein